MYGVCKLTLPPKPLHPDSKTDVFDLIFRVILLLFIAILAIWANNEVSKGFSVTIVNDASKYSLASKRFSLFYESNDKATRLILNSSRFIENLLFPNQDIYHKNLKKQINGVTLRLAPNTFSSIFSVNSPKPYDYLIDLSPSLTENSNNDAIKLAIFQGMARVWLWNDEPAVQAQTPPELVNGVVEYMTSLAGFTPPPVMSSSEKMAEICWKDGDPRKVAGFLRYVDNGGRGDVIRRLNDEMRRGWDDRTMDDALGVEARDACASYDMMIRDMMIRDHFLSSSM